MAKRAGNRSEVKKPRNQRTSSHGAGRVEEHEDDNIGDEAEGVEFNPEKFLTHVESVRELKHKSAEIRGKIGAAVKNAEEDYGIHRGASSLWIKLDGMTPEARDSFLKAFDDMRTALGYATQTELFKTPAEAATFGGRALS